MLKAISAVKSPVSHAQHEGDRAAGAGEGCCCVIRSLREEMSQLGDLWKRQHLRQGVHSDSFHLVFKSKSVHQAKFVGGRLLFSIFLINNSYV